MSRIRVAMLVASVAVAGAAQPLEVSNPAGDECALRRGSTDGLPTGPRERKAAPGETVEKPATLLALV